MNLEHLIQLRRLLKRRKATVVLVQMEPTSGTSNWITGINYTRRDWTPIGHWMLSEEDFNGLKDSGALDDTDIEVS